MAQVLVIARGPKSLPSCPSRAKIGRKDRVMIAMEVNRVGPRSKAVAHCIPPRLRVGVGSQGI